jgi:hypothetical protein
MVTAITPLWLAQDEALTGTRMYQMLNSGTRLYCALCAQPHVSTTAPSDVDRIIKYPHLIYDRCRDWSRAEHPTS